MIFILKGGSTEQKNTVVRAIAQLAEEPVYRRSIMNIPLLILKKHPTGEGAFISEIFDSYIGDALAITDQSFKDVRTHNFGVRHKAQDHNKEEAISSVQKIATSLTSGIDSLFLFNLALRNVGSQNKRHHVFVDLQYKEELTKLNEHCQDEKIIINLKGAYKDNLLPKIDGLSELTEDDLKSYKSVEVNGNAPLTDLIKILVDAGLFSIPIVIEESGTEKIDAPGNGLITQAHLEVAWNGAEDEQVHEIVAEPEMQAAA